jgi:hypothetical protein
MQNSRQVMNLKLRLVYLENIHPFSPFLDRGKFETRAFSLTLEDDHANELPWVVVYYIVIALGCELDGGGSFAPGKGSAWCLFKVALDLYLRTLLLNSGLLEVR